MIARLMERVIWLIVWHEWFSACSTLVIEGCVQYCVVLHSVFLKVLNFLQIIQMNHGKCHMPCWVEQTSSFSNEMWTSLLERFISRIVRRYHVSALAFKRDHFQELYIRRKHINQQQLTKSLWFLCHVLCDYQHIELGVNTLPKFITVTS